MATGLSSSNLGVTSLNNAKYIIQQAFDQITNENELAVITPHAEDLIRMILEICGFVQDNIQSLTESFHRICKDSQAFSMPIHFDKLWEVLNIWSVNNHFTRTREEVNRILKQSIQQSITEFEKLKYDDTPPQELSNIQKALRILKTKLQSLRTKPSQVLPKFTYSDTVTEEQRQELEEVFGIYAREHIMAGRNPTFETLQERQTVLDAGNFLHFCKNYGLVEGHDRDHTYFRPLLRKQILKIFKSNSQFKRDMDFEEFSNSLKVIAERMFQQRVQAISRIPYKTLSNEQKLVMLYEYMWLGKGKRYKRMYKPLVKSFGTDKQSQERIPKGQQSYKFNISPGNQQRLEQYRMAKVQQKLQSSRPAPSEAARQPLRNKSVPRTKAKVQTFLRMQDINNMSLRDVTGSNIADFTQNKAVQIEIQLYLQQCSKILNFFSIIRFACIYLLKLQENLNKNKFRFKLNI